MAETAKKNSEEITANCPFDPGIPQREPHSFVKIDLEQQLKRLARSRFRSRFRLGMAGLSYRSSHRSSQSSVDTIPNS